MDEELPAPTDPAATAAAHAEVLAHAVGELLRFAREGAATKRFPFGLDDVATIMAEALQFILFIETAAAGVAQAEIDAGMQLHAALTKWLDDVSDREGWWPA